VRIDDGATIAPVSRLRRLINGLGGAIAEADR